MREQTKHILPLVEVGNDLAILFPQDLLDCHNLKAGDAVFLTKKGTGFKIKAKEKASFRRKPESR